MRGLSENLQCKNHYFLTKWWDLLDLSKIKILLDLVHMQPGGVRTATDLFFFFLKSAIMKHLNHHHGKHLVKKKAVLMFSPPFPGTNGPVCMKDSITFMCNLSYNW